MAHVPTGGTPASRYRGVQIDAQGHARQHVIAGVQQRFRTQRSGRFLRTTLSEGAMEAHPALATALRRFPDAVLVGRVSRGARAGVGPGYLLHGPVVQHPGGRDVYLRLEVAPDGQTHGRVMDAGTDQPVGQRALLSRDWQARPAVVRVPRMPRRLFIMSDIHGENVMMRDLLAQGGLVRDGGVRPRWTGGRATLVINGDLMNKGPDTLGVIDYVRELQSQAARMGGCVIVTLGNHEFHNIARMDGRRYDAGGASAEMTRAGTFPEDFALGRDRRGRGEWIRNLPVAARVGDVLFVHSGDTNGRTLEEMARGARRDIDRRGFRGPNLGFDESQRESMLFSEHWERDGNGGLNTSRIETNLRNTGTRSIVAGHNSEMLRGGQRGRIATTPDGTLNAVDSNMPRTARDGTTPAMMLIETRAGRSAASEIDIHGQRRPLWERDSSVPPDR